MIQIIASRSKIYTVRSWKLLHIFGILVRAIVIPVILCHIQKLKQEKDQLEQSLEKVTQESTLKQLADAKLRRDYADAVTVLDRIPKEVLDAYTRGGHGRKERPIEQNL